MFYSRSILFVLLNLVIWIFAVFDDINFNQISDRLQCFSSHNVTVKCQSRGKLLLIGMSAVFLVQTSKDLFPKFGNYYRNSM